MNIREILVFNSALEGRQIFGLPDFEEYYSPYFIVQETKQQMIESGLLETADTFTDKGARIAQRIHDYQKARKYVRIGSLIIGLISEKEGVVLKPLQSGEDYMFERVDLEDKVSAFFDAYAFLRRDSTISQATDKQDTNPKEALSLETVMRKYSPRFEESVFLSTVDLREAKNVHEIHVINEFFFHSDGMLYIYDQDAESLTSVSNESIETYIAERISL